MERIHQLLLNPMESLISLSEEMEQLSHSIVSEVMEKKG